MGSGLEKLSHNANQWLKDGAVAVGNGVWTPGNGEGIIFPPGDWNCPACNNVVFGKFSGQVIIARCTPLTTLATNRSPRRSSYAIACTPTNTT